MSERERDCVRNSVGERETTCMRDYEWVGERYTMIDGDYECACESEGETEWERPRG